MAEVNQEPVGLAWGRIETSDPDVAYLYQMWVAPVARRQGIGGMLVEAVIAWAKQQRASYLELGVTVGNDPAFRLYRRYGFESDRELDPLRPGSELYEQRMRLNLNFIDPPLIGRGRVNR